jgi:hypothetical protein
MSDFVGLFCLAAIWAFGFACGCMYMSVRLRGRPRIVFPEVKDETPVT